MLFRTLGLCLLLISTTSYAVGRKPAVEDFVGIEFEDKQVAPQGTESLYNLEQDIQRIESQPKKTVGPKISQTPEQSNWGMKAVFGISLALCLPLVIWLLVMSHLRKKASIESASNIEVLEKYRRDREKKSEEKIRKVS
ncbi:MAG: hypothetical protein ACLGHN_13060 [Bacteriovoracia bacterium]